MEIFLLISLLLLFIGLCVDKGGKLIDSKHQNVNFGGYKRVILQWGKTMESQI